MNLLSFLNGLRADFAMALKAGAKPQSDIFSQTVNSSESSEVYVVMAAMSGYVETEDEYSFEDMDEYLQRQVNKEYHKGISVDRNKFKDSKTKLGNLFSRVNAVYVAKWGTLHDKLLGALLELNPTAFDGTAFFANSRDYGTVDNIVTGTGTDVDEVYADLVSAKTAMRSQESPDGEAFNETLNFVVYAPKHLVEVFEQIRTSETLNFGTGSQSNYLKNSFEVRTNNYQATTNDDWYLFNSAHEAKPVLNQIRENAKLYTEDNEVNSPKIRYLAKGRRCTALMNFVAAVWVNNA